MTEKKCYKCKVNKTLEEFYRNKNMKDGRNNTCKLCTRAYKKIANKNRKKMLGINYGINEKMPVIKNFWNEVKHKEKISFTALFNGLSGAGKSTMLIHMLKELKPHYDLICLVSQNIKMELYQHPVFDVLIHRDDLCKIIKLIRYFQQETNSYLRVIIILDDVVNAKVKYNPAIEDLILNGRNLGISTIYSTQTPMLVTPNQRKNFHFLMLFRDLDSESIATTIRLFLDKFVKIPKKLKVRERAEWLASFLYKATENYNVLVLNKKAKTYEERFSTYRAKLPL